MDYKAYDYFTHELLARNIHLHELLKECQGMNCYEDIVIKHPDGRVSWACVTSF